MIETAQVTRGVGAPPALSTAWLALSERRRVAMLAALTVLISLAYAWMVLASQVGSVVSLLVWLGLMALAWQPRIGLIVAFGMVLLFEDGGPDALMQPGYYFYAGIGKHLGLGGVLPSPIEVLLALSLLIWLVKGIMRRRLDFRGGVLLGPMLLFCAALLVGLGRGLLGNAPLNTLLWEFRFPVYIVACYFLATNTLRSRGDARSLIGVSLVVMTLFGLEWTYRKLALFDTGILNVPQESAFSHESVVFMGTLIMLVIAQQVFGAPPWQRLLGMVALPVCGFALMASERRSGQIAVIIAFVALSLVFLAKHRKAFLVVSLPVVIAFSVYLPVFWNSSGVLGQPARAVRSLYQPDPRDFSSNFYREMEKINIYATIRANPIAGVGFGRPFLIIIQLVDVSFWPLWMHQPHNNIMWIWLKMGAVGFIAFWTLMGTALMRAAHLAGRLRAPEARVFAVLTLCGLITSLVFCYVDLALTGARVTVLLGTLMGGLAVLDDLYD